MEGRIKLYITIFTLGLLMVNSSFAESYSTPELPAQYYGEVISPTPLNGYIIVKIGDKNYSSISLVNNTFGGLTYSDGKLIVYAPGKDNAEIKFYLNGSILLNTLNTVRYNSGDIKYVELYYNIDTEKLKILNKTVRLDGKLDEKILNIVDINNVSNYSIGGIEIAELPLRIENREDTVIIPIVDGIPEKENFVKIIKNINKTHKVAESIKKKVIDDESDVEEVVETIAKNITKVLSLNFDITNITKDQPKKVGNKIISNITFTAKNTSQKGFIIVRIPIGNLKVENILISNKTATVTLEKLDKSNVGNKTEWYRIPTEGVLEIALIRDPNVSVILSVDLPKETTSREETTRDISTDTDLSSIAKIVTEDIKSVEIRHFIHKAKLITGSEIDINLSAKYLKTDINLVTTPIRIQEDCILVGGPVANPVVKKYLNYFPVKVTNKYPGKHRGVIEVIKINGHTVVLLAGSDRWGTKAAVEYFKTLEDLPEEFIFVEWRDKKAVRIEKP